MLKKFKTTLLLISFFALISNLKSVEFNFIQERDSAINLLQNYSKDEREKIAKLWPSFVFQDFKKASKEFLEPLEKICNQNDIKNICDFFRILIYSCNILSDNLSGEPAGRTPDAFLELIKEGLDKLVSNEEKNE